MPKKIEWWMDALQAIGRLGGKARLKDIYPIVYELRSARGSSLGEYQAWVRNAIQNNSRGRGLDIFEHLAKGVWGIKLQPASSTPPVGQVLSKG